MPYEAILSNILFVLGGNGGSRKNAFWDLLTFTWKSLALKYFFVFQESDFDPVDNCLASVLGQDVELTDEFKANYQTWLQREVYNTEIQWELLLEDVENPKSQFTI